MRQILNISLPMSMVKSIKTEVKNGEFSSVSEFIRHLIRLYNTEKLAKEIDLNRKDFEAGKGIELKSFEDLDK
jgi:Arc/MetJ-type ribon-helix-helix transcriptional regulator